MKKIIIIALALLALSGCACGSCSEQQSQRNESRYIPEGAVLLKEYCSNRNKNCDDKRWARWKFENECFLSYSLASDNAMLTKVDCEEIH